MGNAIDRRNGFQVLRTARPSTRPQQSDSDPSRLSTLQVLPSSPSPPATHRRGTGSCPESLAATRWIQAGRGKYFGYPGGVMYPATMSRPATFAPSRRAECTMSVYERLSLQSGRHRGADNLVHGHTLAADARASSTAGDDYLHARPDEKPWRSVQSSPPPPSLPSAASLPLRALRPRRLRIPVPPTTLRLMIMPWCMLGVLHRHTGVLDHFSSSSPRRGTVAFGLGRVAMEILTIPRSSAFSSSSPSSSGPAIGGFAAHRIWIASYFSALNIPSCTYHSLPSRRATSPREPHARPPPIHRAPADRWWITSIISRFLIRGSSPPDRSLIARDGFRSTHGDVLASIRWYGCCQGFLTGGKMRSTICIDGASQAASAFLHTQRSTSLLSQLSAQLADGPRPLAASPTSASFSPRRPSSATVAERSTSLLWPLVKAWMPRPLSRRVIQLPATLRHRNDRAPSFARAPTQRNVPCISAAAAAGMWSRSATRCDAGKTFPHRQKLHSLLPRYTSFPNASC
ncbi:hypothetical protein DFH06DRAFT_1316565 [Mycena polygramma]|nr:hypothetical protein DFH06DRAFT_1316565 [Mycena polygramma]